MLGCSSDDDNNDPTQNQFENIEADVQEGLWEISAFINAGEDDTFTFESYVFDFSGDGTVIASTDLLSATGTWEYMGLNENESAEIFQLSFAGSNPPEPFDRLTENWEIVAASSTTLQLVYETVDVNKTLTFTKVE
tara:strand:+ start:25576 stop:25983 length:408 start_codon:yes stop_codon:yes gene_type:complete